jgi:TetR/AcrR family transcriptional repressor of nem operon
MGWSGWLDGRAALVKNNLTGRLIFCKGDLVEARPAGKRGPKPKPGTRANIVQAGLQTIHSDGYGATGIQTIVAHAGVPKGSFYNHFESKEAFGAEVIDAYSARAQETMVKFLTDAKVAPIDRLRAYFADRIEAFRDKKFARGCLLGNFSAEAADHSALLRGKLAEHFAAWSGLIETCIEEAQLQGVVDKAIPAHVLADFVFNAWEGALLRMRAEQSDAPLRTFERIVFEKLLG